MDIKMIVTDLDNTLLRNDKTISEYTINILKKCQEKGIKVAFATARPRRVVDHFLEQINCDGVIYHNGALVYVERTSISEASSVPIDYARKSLLYLQEKYPDMRLSIEIDNTLYTNFDVNEIWPYSTAIRTDFTDLPEKDVDKLLINISDISQIEDLLGELPEDLYYEISDGNFCIIMNKQATKFQAISILARHFEIDLDSIIAFGDDYNDIEMIQNCSIGVAMKNAIQEVKDVANYIADTNENDGVARFIEEHCL